MPAFFFDSPCTVNISRPVHPRHCTGTRVDLSTSLVGRSRLNRKEIAEFRKLILFSGDVATRRLRRWPIHTEFRQLGKSGLQVPVLCFGTGTLGGGTEFLGR